VERIRADVTAEAPILAVRGARKRFGGVKALDDVDFELRPGEIHALLGENGAGKSTLVKLLAGVVAPDQGDVLVAGTALPGGFTPADVKAAGIAFVHQDLGLIGDLSVAENIALSTGYRRGHTGLIAFRETERRVGGDLARLGLHIRAAAPVRVLAQDEKVMVAVARAFALDARAIVLDEVTSSLPAPEAARLADALRSTRDAGLGIVYVTHRIDEIFGLADRVTVLRNGRRVVTADVADTDHDEIVEWILGPEAATAVRAEVAYRRRPAAGNAPARLVVRDLRCAGLHEAVSFDVAAGEIVGLCGLVGCGARELAAALGGALPPRAGGASLDGRPLPLGDPSALRRLGCTYVPGDRQAAGGVFNLSVRENLFMIRGTGQDGDRFVRRPSTERAEALRLAARFDIRPRGRVDQPLGALSGGNQQKAILGRALRCGPSLLVVDDPTAGVDIGSRAQVHAIVREAADAGCAVVLASTDFDEVAAHADRALVMWHGRVGGQLSGGELTSSALARASYGPRTAHRKGEA
jgi:ribose transport system ATP-binding protein